MPLAQKSRLQSAILPAPSGGLNTTSDGTATSAGDCLVLWNMVAAEYGLRTRLGYRDWVTGLDGEVRSLLPYTGTAKNRSKDRLFAVTQTGIYDVTTQGTRTTAARKVTFGTSNADSGWGVSTAFQNAAGGFLCYTDEANGYFLYTESTDAWTQAVSGAPGAGQFQLQEAQGQVPALPALDPAKLCFVTAWKHMLWFAERDTGRGWYLPANQIGGAGTAGAFPFYFGSKFRNGGDLRGLWSWTFDGGSGIDDALVAISSGGDVLVYKGSDPTQASGFYQAGNWFLGGMPAGRRVCTETGGDLLVLTSLGLLPLSTITGGALLSSQQYVTQKVGNLFNQLAASYGTVRGWAARLHPIDNTLMVLVPTGSGLASQQLVMSTLNKSWSRYRYMPIGVCAEAWSGTLYFGTEDGRVCINDGYLDALPLTWAKNTAYAKGVSIANSGLTYVCSTAGTSSNAGGATGPTGVGTGIADGTAAWNYAGTGVGGAIDFSLITTFQDLGRPTQKRVQLIRPTFMSQGSPPTYSAEARYGWDLTEATPPAQSPGISGAAWDSALWDQSTWGGGDYEAQRRVFGARGVGPQIAIAIHGLANSRMTLAGVDVIFDEGGIL